MRYSKIQMSAAPKIAAKTNAIMRPVFCIVITAIKVFTKNWINSKECLREHKQSIVENEVVLKCSVNDLFAQAKAWSKHSVTLCYVRAPIFDHIEYNYVAEFITPITNAFVFQLSPSLVL